MKKIVLHFLISLFLVQFLVMYNLAALELPAAKGRTTELSVSLPIELNCDVTESSGKSNDFAVDKPLVFSGMQEFSSHISTRAFFTRFPAVHRPFLSSYKDICHPRL